MENRPHWTLSETIARTTVSRSTLRRYTDAGKFPNSYKTQGGVWMYPVEDLLAAGIRMRPSEQPERHLSVVTDQPPEQPAATAELARLRLDLAVERERNAGLQEQLALAKQGQSDLRQALHILEPPKQTGRRSGLSRFFG